VQSIVFVVVLLLLLLLVIAVQATLSARIESILFRVGRLERRQGEFSHSVIKVQGWAEQQLHAVRSEFTVARVNDSAARVLELRAHKRVASAAPLLLPEEDPEEKRDTISMLAPKPSDEEGEATTFFKPEPPLYARRSALMRPPAPLSHPDLIGSEDVPEEAAQMQLGPEEKTPPRHGRAAMLLAEYSVSEEGGAE